MKRGLLLLPHVLLVSLLWATANDAAAEEQGFIHDQSDLWVTAAWDGWRADERFAGPFGADPNFRGFPDNPRDQVEPGDRVPIKLDVPVVHHCGRPLDRQRYQGAR